ncbi:cell division protein FtsX [Yoonia sediminilitoris]|uniref:Cell division transport system permease protein n=1 Tax=Yoonia sediminilitoris TaxID=1286148 RepID=A0A2T6KI74_9RHOB|nr:FtsX-like permease family protein [Yoonia sediminilitoris]PUB15436.1 cell division transport system permease protein [Yoonia sediminilitoris]RCW96046.1 cell division transport system permease protein [Yoonia sediminilitoris]
MKLVLDLLIGDAQSDRVVPPTGIAARLTVFVAGAMAFLAVLAVALTLTAARVADAWANELAQAATLRLPVGADDALVIAALNLLETTPGIASARVLSDAEQAALLAPWLGADIGLDELPVPRLIAIVAEDQGYDAAGLRARLTGEMPTAVLDDHGRWRAPLVQAASRVRLVGWFSFLLIVAAMAAMIVLAAHASLAAHAQVIRVLRLVGARDVYIARAFVRRFTLRTGLGAIGGVIIGLLALELLPDADTAGGFLANVGFEGAGWLWPLVIPLLAAIVGFVATRAAAMARLRDQT